MKITFVFENGTSQVHLAPESTRDERYLDLCLEGKASVSIIPSKDKILSLQFSNAKDKMCIGCGHSLHTGTCQVTHCECISRWK